MDEWIDSTPPDDPRTHGTPTRPGEGAAKTTKSQSQEGSTKKHTQDRPKNGSGKKEGTTLAKPTLGRKAVADVAPDRSAIGSNPERRFASAPSRNLARKS